MTIFRRTIAAGFGFMALSAVALAQPSAVAPESDDSESIAPPEPGPEFGTGEPETRQPSEAAVAAQEMIDTALKGIDESIERQGNVWQFQIGERVVLVVTDPLAERMRILVPVAPAEAITAETAFRLLQANCDSALDARYAIAQDLLWGTFIHNLTSLSEQEFLSGLLQTLNIANTFGTTYSSGAMVFGGGDSQAIMEGELEELIRQLEDANRT
ncbi:MAG: hypothetical protein AAGE05_14060 [Pseudomonadota bacterium]